MIYKPSQQISIIGEVIENKLSVYSVCRKYNISKVTFYRWLSIYKRARKNRHASLASRVREGNNHYRSLTAGNKFKILTKVHRNPELSCHQIARSLGLGNHAVQNLLEKEGLNRVEQRVEFSKKPFWKRETAERRQGMMELYEQGWMIDSICRHYKISKPTFFKWRQRYLEAKELGRLLSLGDRYVSGNVHHKYIDESVKDKVVEIVAHNPSWSVHTIAASVAQAEGKSVIGHHAIQDLLLVKDLNTIEKRRLYAQGFVRQLAPAIQIYDTPVPGLSVWRLLYAPFKTVPKWVLKHPASWPIVFPAVILAAWVIEVDKLLNPAFFFPFVALTFGMFFFLYSLKYYFSLIMVMKIAQNGDGSQSQSGQMSMPAKFFSRFVSFAKISQPISNVNPLTLNFSKVDLKSRPFVSIHAPIYNEKRVVERLIKACSLQNWIDEVSGKANFEVVIVDDSTDTTTEIVKQKLSEGGRKLTRTVSSEAMEVYVSEVGNGPTIKLIHRFNRQGYKGAALGNAMNFIDPRVEYVCVFDADFVPYPDTIEQFMKSFQEACGGLEKVAESKIAAVQGYQWHVLNKSENWVTRGVRTEYAGSYVVERAGIGIYGGLNQIAGSVFCIRADVLKAFGWKTSITEDLQLTLRLYEQGFKVVFNPYIQAPAEAVSTVKRLIRQRMRWAEGHTFNVKQMWQKMMYSQRLSKREKFEFMYLAPYYLQAAFFLIGVSAWFISEVIVHTRLPFWTAAWGWSLVFTNFLALPLMNLAGLFLEESEEKDYVGVASFMLLSYIVVPFQAYAAVKALLETEEGPWFRTPKTGLITNDYNRGKFYGWVEKLKAIGGAGVSSAQSTVQSVQSVGQSGFGGGFNFARVSAHNPLSGYKIMPRRKNFVSRGVIAGFLIIIIFMNYLAFFVPQTAEAHHGANHLEQQYNIIDQVYSTVSTSVVPTDNSLGLVTYPASADLTSPTEYFEAVIKTSNASGVTTAGLYQEDDATTPYASVTTSSTTYVRVRASASLSNSLNYSVRIKTSDAAYTASIESARIIVEQNPGSGNITDTQTMIELGNNQTTSSTSGSLLTAFKSFCFSTASAAPCTGGDSGDSSIWTPAPAVTFEATLKNSNAGVVTTAQLYDRTSASLVTNGDATVTGTTWALNRNTAGITLTPGHVYAVHLKTGGASSTASIANAKLILQQTDATAITKLETEQLYNNTTVTEPASSYTTEYYDNAFTRINLQPVGASAKFYFESILWDATACGGKGQPVCGVGAQLWDGTTSSAITNSTVTTTVSTAGTAAWLRSADITSNLPASGTDTLQVQLSALVASNSVTSNMSRLLVQIGSLNVPEISIVAVPFAFMFPKLAKKIREMFAKRKKKKGGSSPKPPRKTVK